MESQQPRTSSSDEGVFRPVIAAIDFGTSSSGYAYAFQGKLSDGITLSDIRLNKWQTGSNANSTDKAPTTVLLKPDKTFNSFGYKAEDEYAKLCQSNKQKGWWYFQEFKMMLYKRKLSREVELTDAEGKTMPARYVFSAVIGHLKECILEDVKKENLDIKDDDILYVLTVPAIWSDAAKQFMREAATDVGINDSQLNLVLEPEAASVCCRHVKSRVVREPSGEARLESMEVGHKYIILDMGGGTADMAAHELIENGKLHELDYARGDNFGGQRFNEQFIQFLNDLFGVEIFRKWSDSKPIDYLRLLRAIEGIKWAIAENDDEDDDDEDEDVLLVVPFSLAKHFEDASVQEKLTQPSFKLNVKLEEDVNCLFNNKLLKGFFDSILTGITKHVRDICNNTDAIEKVFLVGGLAKSSYVINNIKTEFPTFKLIIPEDPGVAVLKGAVMLGNKPQTIAGRIARYSYGVEIALKFEAGMHDERHKFTRDGEVLCKHLFQKMIEKGQVLKFGDTFKTTGYINAILPETKRTVFDVDLYQSARDDPSYCSESDCTELGGIKQFPPITGWPEITTFEIHITVGEAEFKFHVTDSLGRTYKTTLDFLSQKTDDHA